MNPPAKLFETDDNNQLGPMFLSLIISLVVLIVAMLISGGPG